MQPEKFSELYDQRFRRYRSKTVFRPPLNFGFRKTHFFSTLATRLLYTLCLQSTWRLRNLLPISAATNGLRVLAKCHFSPKRPWNGRGRPNDHNILIQPSPRTNASNGVRLARLRAPLTTQSAKPTLRLTALFSTKNLLTI